MIRDRRRLFRIFDFLRTRAVETTDVRIAFEAEAAGTAALDDVAFASATDAFGVGPAAGIVGPGDCGFDALGGGDGRSDTADTVASFSGARVVAPARFEGATGVCPVGSGVTTTGTGRHNSASCQVVTNATINPANARNRDRRRRAFATEPMVRENQESYVAGPRSNARADASALILALDSDGV